MRIRIVLNLTLYVVFSSCLTGQISRELDHKALASYLDQANDYYEARDYKEAIETLDVLIQNIDPETEIELNYKGYEMLGHIYASLKDFKKTEEKYLQAKEIAKKSKNDTLIAASYGNLGSVYLLLPDQAAMGISNYQKSINLNKRLNRNAANLNAYINLGRAYLKNGNLKEAYPRLLEGQQVAQEDSLNYKGNVQTLTLMGRYHSEKNQMNLAEEALLQAVDLAFAQGLIAEEEEAQMELGHFYKKQENFEAAYYHTQRQLQLANELYKNQKEREIQIASAQFDTRQYQRELEVAKNNKALNDKLFSSSRKTTTIFVISSVVLLIALLIIFQMYGSRKQYIKRLRRNNRQLILAKEEAEKLSKLKTQFFSTISHELRTPLYGVIGIASILLEDKHIKTHRDDLKSLKFSADYLLALINDVLLMSKMEAKHIELEYVPFRLSTLLKSITRSFEFSLEQNKNKLHLEIDENIPDHLVGDSVRLSQILMNLIGNAIKFNENGNIWVYIQNQSSDNSSSHDLKFTIKDDGIGIPKESQGKIFEEFGQVQQTNYNYQGTGLGLPIVRKLLHLHGSEIHLESDKGEGATFTFTIKLQEAYDEDNTCEVIYDDSHIIEGEASASAHILIVDDNKINQKITQKILEQKEYTCSIANDGEEAVLMAGQHNYDLILMDIHMPKKDGIEATIAIREFDEETPIIALTAVEIAEIRHKIQHAGMDDILIKPYDISRFLNVILRNLRGRRTKSLQSSGS